MKTQVPCFFHSDFEGEMLVGSCLYCACQHRERLGEIERGGGEREERGLYKLLFLGARRQQNLRHI